ncbi:MAG: hypothetical protein ACRCYZ_06865 [Alphaproteobacteria bacterium]
MRDDDDDDTPPLLPINRQIAEAWSMLADGWGAIDWQSLPWVAQWIGVTDVEALVSGLMTIKTARRPDDRSSADSRMPASYDDYDEDDS